MRWWNEWPSAEAEAIAAGYSLEEFEESIPEIQKLVDDKRNGIAAPTSFMPREERLRTFSRANVPIIVSNQSGGNATRNFDEPAFRSANALLDEYAVAYNKNNVLADASRKGSFLAPQSDDRQKRDSVEKGEEPGAWCAWAISEGKRQRSGTEPTPSAMMPRYSLGAQSPDRTDCKQCLG